MLIDYHDLESPSIYKLMSQTVIPRPIAWIVTEDRGVVNIAPFSYFTPLSSTPPAVVVSIGHKANGEPKDTLSNVRKTKKATICMVDEAHIQKMHNSSKSLPKNESEAELFDIPTKKVYDDFPPLIEGIHTAFFCELNQEIDLGGPTIPLIFNIRYQYIFSKNVVNQEKLYLDIDNIARVGKSYAKIGDNLKVEDIPV